MVERGGFTEVRRWNNDQGRFRSVGSKQHMLVVKFSLVEVSSFVGDGYLRGFVGEYNLIRVPYT